MRLATSAMTPQLHDVVPPAPLALRVQRGDIEAAIRPDHHRAAPRPGQAGDPLDKEVDRPGGGVRVAGSQSAVDDQPTFAFATEQWVVRQPPALVGIGAHPLRAEGPERESSERNAT